MNRRIPGAQMNAWVLTAAVGPILSVIGRNGWMTVLIAAVASGALSFCILSCKQVKLPRWLCVLELVWIAVFISGIGRISSTCWAEESFPAIPVVLLILGAFAASRGSAPAARAGATLAWLVIPVFAIVAIAGTADVNTSWIRMELEIPDSVLISLLLTPCLCAFLPQESTVGIRWSAAILGVLSVIGAVLMDGLMGATGAAHADNSFYEFSKSINLFGIAKRFEALIACVLTGSWFALFVLILSATYHLTEEIFVSAGKYGVWAVTLVSAVLMCILPNRSDWLAVGTLIFWGFLPVAAQGIVGAKNMEKK